MSSRRVSMRMSRMRRRLNRFLLCSCVVVLALLLSTANFSVSAKAKNSYPVGSPTRAIQDLDDMLGDFVVKKKGEKLSEEEEEHNRSLKMKIVHGTFDIRELAKLSLAAHWANRSDKEQERFVKILTDILEEKALFSKEQSAAKSKSGGKYYVEYRGQKLNKAKVRAFVQTKVVVPSENIKITLNYKLRKQDGDWKIYDIIVDEASLVENYRYQFNSIIKKHGYPDLVRRMENKLNEIRAKRKS